jgi:hypothetical protein
LTLTRWNSRFLGTNFGPRNDIGAGFVVKSQATPIGKMLQPRICCMPEPNWRDEAGLFRERSNQDVDSGRSHSPHTIRGSTLLTALSLPKSGPVR